MLPGWAETDEASGRAGLRVMEESPYGRASCVLVIEDLL